MTHSTTLETFRSSFESISLVTGEEFFRLLITGIRDSLQIDSIWVAEYHKEQNSMTTMAFNHKGEFLKNFTYLLDGTPCETLINSDDLVHFSGKIAELFPKDHKMLEKFGSESYLGTSLHDVNGEVIGCLAMLHGQRLDIDDEVTSIIRIIRQRAEAEMQRLKREKELLYREHQLRGLINGVQDLLINLDNKGKITMLNAVAESGLGVPDSAAESLHIAAFLADNSKSRLLTVIEKVNARSDGNYLWIPDSLVFTSRSGETFSTEGTISRYELDEKVFYTLVLRNTEDKDESSEKVKQLIEETVYLRDELEEIKDANQLVGESPSMKRLLQNVYMVAHTDATVLIHGATGTGKELVARHIHQISNRRNKPMITVNCGAIPPSLIESEFFGHARGAFTGATAERKGRFQMADGGTIFLDEIGELPLDLQVKLLRVIQESEFEPVGSSKTIKVDVRIIAATHRNLFELAQENKFREDLYYRLNVFPVEVPPLRERNDDVILIANTFIQKFAKRNNRKVNPLTDEQKSLLKLYHWPGNIRELQNIIERSVILVQNGNLNFSATLSFPATTKKVETTVAEERILTKDEFLEFEKQNILRALKAARWKVSGKDGAAALLRMVPSTLSSRILALGIKVPKDQ